MVSTLAFEIGAVLLLCGMLMYGSLSGFIPRSLYIGKPLAVILGIGVLVLLMYRAGPDIFSQVRSLGTIAPVLTTPPPPVAAPVDPPKAAVKSETPRPIAKKAQSVEPRWKTTVLIDSPSLEVAEPGSAVSPTPERLTPETAVPSPSDCCKADAKDDGPSPYDSGAKRAIKSVGRFFHIGRKKKPQQ